MITTMSQNVNMAEIVGNNQRYQHNNQHEQHNGNEENNIPQPPTVEGLYRMVQQLQVQKQKTKKKGCLLKW